MNNGKIELAASLEPGVTIIDALSSAGKTLAFGLCKEVVAKKMFES